MLNVFIVTLAPGHDPDEILSEETKRETMAQVMSPAEAAAVGFAGIPAPPAGHEQVLIAVNARDARWLHRSLESHPAVTSYTMREVD